MSDILLQSTVTCPECGRASRHTMPEDACVIRSDCPACHATLAPRKGDCCIFCSYGDIPCPPVQKGTGCC